MVHQIQKRLDYEAPLHSFDVEIEAADQGEPQLRTRVPLHVTVRTTSLEHKTILREISLGTQMNNLSGVIQCF